MAKDDVKEVTNAEKGLTRQQCRWEVYARARETPSNLLRNYLPKSLASAQSRRRSKAALEEARRISAVVFVRLDKLFTSSHRQR
jgi:hypothetical protein